MNDLIVQLIRLRSYLHTSTKYNFLKKTLNFFFVKIVEGNSSYI